mgnify:CR=1 FL=1
MAKVYFYYSSMNAGKSTTLLQAAWNYRERGMQPLLLTDRKSTRLNSSHVSESRMPSSA